MKTKVELKITKILPSLIKVEEMNFRSTRKM